MRSNRGNNGCFGMESLLAQLGCEERDNKFQEQVAEQLLAAQQAISLCHENVLHLMGRKLEAMRHVEVENQILFERIAVLGGPSSSSSSYVQAGKITEGTNGVPGTINVKPANMTSIEPQPPTTYDPPPPPQQALTAILPEGEPSSMCMLPGEPDTPLGTVNEDFDGLQEERGSIIKRDSCGSILSLQIVPIAKADAHAKEMKRNSCESMVSLQPPSKDDGRASVNTAISHSISYSGCVLDSRADPRHSGKSAVSWSPMLDDGDVDDNKEPCYKAIPSVKNGDGESSGPGRESICGISAPIAYPHNRSHGTSGHSTSAGAWQRRFSEQIVKSKTESSEDINSYRRTLTDFASAAKVATRVSNNISQYARAASARLRQAEGKFEVLAEWEIENEANYRAKVGTIVRKTTKDNRDLIRKATMMHAKQNDQHEERKFIRYCRKTVIHPCGIKRAIWDMMSLMLVTYDMAVLPLQFFDPAPSTFSTTMAWYTRIFWTVDMPVSISTGFLLSDGSIQMHPGEVAKRYVMTWFVLDFFLVALDWLEVFFQSSASSTASDYGRLGKMGRTFRIIRMVRLLRLVRMREILKLMTFRMQSERLVIMADIAKILTIIIAVAHLMACFWYGIADDNNPENSWLGDQMVQDMELEHKYLISMHWAVSQFSGGMDEFRAKNFEERFYNVTVFLAAFMMAAVCVSGLTSSMTRLHILSSHQSRQLSTLRRYLIQNGISDRLALRVQRNALHAISEQQRLMAEKHVELLSAVSEPLRVELHFEMYSPVLEVHPFFHKYIQECPQVMMRVCHQAMSTLLVSCGDVIFNAGEIPEQPKFYIVCNGQMEYIPNSGAVTPVLAEEWLSEGALWTHWMHRGVLKAKSDGRLCIMDAKKFLQIVLQFDHPEFDPREYAIEYVKNLNELQDDKVTITDLKMEDQEELIDTFGMGLKSLPTMKFGARHLLGQFAAANRNMMDTPKRRESVLFIPSKTAKIKRNGSKGRLIQ